MCSLGRFLQHRVPAHVAARRNTQHVSTDSFLQHHGCQLLNASFLWEVFQQIPQCRTFPWTASFSTQEECFPVHSLCMELQQTSSSSTESWLQCLQQGMDLNVGVEGEEEPHTGFFLPWVFCFSSRGYSLYLL